jgi:hypothetical protein
MLIATNRLNLTSTYSDLSRNRLSSVPEQLFTTNAALKTVFVYSNMLPVAESYQGFKLQFADFSAHDVVIQQPSS